MGDDSTRRTERWWHAACHPWLADQYRL